MSGDYRIVEQTKTGWRMIVTVDVIYQDDSGRAVSRDKFVDERDGHGLVGDDDDNDDDDDDHDGGNGDEGDDDENGGNGGNGDMIIVEDFERYEQW